MDLFLDYLYFILIFPLNQTHNKMKNKEAFMQKLEGRLESWKADIDKMKAKMKEADADTKIKLESKISDLKFKLKEGQHKLDQIKNASESKWESMKNDMENMWKEMETSMDKAKDKVLS